MRDLYSAAYNTEQQHLTATKYLKYAVYMVLADGSVNVAECSQAELSSHDMT